MTIRFSRIAYFSSKMLAAPFVLASLVVVSMPVAVATEPIVNPVNLDTTAAGHQALKGNSFAGGQAGREALGDFARSLFVDSRVSLAERRYSAVVKIYKEKINEFNSTDWGRPLYDEWKAFISEDYKNRDPTAPLMPAHLNRYLDLRDEYAKEEHAEMVAARNEADEAQRAARSRTPNSDAPPGNANRQSPADAAGITGADQSVTASDQDTVPLGDYNFPPGPPRPRISNVDLSIEDLPVEYVTDVEVPKVNTFK